MIIITIILSLVSVLLIYWYWLQNWSRRGKMINAFPGPSVLPLIGNLHLCDIREDNLYYDIQKIIKSSPETLRGWGTIFPSIHIKTPEDAEMILPSTKYIKKSVIYDVLHNWLGTGLLTSDGAKWQARRKLLTPAFHFSILQKSVDIFGEHCEKLLTQLENEARNDKTDVKIILKQLTLGIICETAMGIKLNLDDKEQQNYFQSLQKMVLIIIYKMFRPWLIWDFLFKLTSIGRDHYNAVKLLHKFTDNVIKTREKLLEIDNVDNDIVNVDKKKRLAMLDLLLLNKKQLATIDYEGIREEVDTFVFAGHDTTSAASSIALMLLANNKNAQEKIIIELDEIFGDSKRTANYDDLQKMKYLEMCIKECLRLYPSVPNVSRYIMEDLKLTKHTVPKGATIFIHIHHIHRNPRYYPDPEKFDPDRFLPENMKNRHPYAYIPFSAGPRNCIGQKFAMLQLKTIISSILRNFTLEAIDSEKTLHWVVDFVQNNKGPIYVKFVKRHK